MKLWIIPALLAAALLGYAIGRLAPQKTDSPGSATSSPRAIPRQESTALPAMSETMGLPKVPPVAPSAATSPQPPRQRLVEMLSGYLDVDKLYSTLSQAAYRDAKLQREIFDILRTTDDAGLMAQCQALLLSIKEPDLRGKLIEAFRTEKNSDRRSAWAYILGANWDKAELRPIVFEVLEASDSKVQERMLQRMCLQQLQFKSLDDDMERAAARLRLLVRAGGDDGLRAAAANALRGVQKPEDVSFLIETMLQDPNAEVQASAFHSLPSNYQSPSPLLPEQTRAMYQAAVDVGRAPKFRKMCADRALQNSITEKFDSDASQTLTPQERATLESIVGKKPGE